ncbi:uncharacterized protein [Amphiura filiformis]|uniref:uncharacterized protein n=1 Tax=Amphiura filiformis TaxID=82378 RepID=UPI003B214780
MAANSMRKKPIPKADESSESAAAKAARDKLRGVQNVDTGENFDKAWERVYGSKEYRPSWVGKIDDKGGRRMLPPPPKSFQPKPKQVPIKEEVKPKTDDTKGIPDRYRAKHVPKPLTIGGRVLPKEKELTKWKKDIESDELDEEGNPVYNKVVKKTNVKGWINNNGYWQPPKVITSIPPKQKKRQPVPAPKNQVIHKSKYDLVGKFENRVRNPDLKLGAKEIPKEPELKKWGDDLEIPDNTLEEDYTASAVEMNKKSTTRRVEGRRLTTRLSHPQPSSKKWNDVLETADVPSFFTKNTFWES